MNALDKKLENLKAERAIYANDPNLSDFMGVRIDYYHNEIMLIESIKDLYPYQITLENISNDNFYEIFRWAVDVYTGGIEQWNNYVLRRHRVSFQDVTDFIFGFKNEEDALLFKITWG